MPFGTAASNVPADVWLKSRFVSVPVPRSVAPIVPDVHPYPRVVVNVVVFVTRTYPAATGEDAVPKSNTQAGAGGGGTSLSVTLSAADPVA